MKTAIFAALFLLALPAHAEESVTPFTTPGGAVLVPTWQEHLAVKAEVDRLITAKAADIDYSARIDVLEAELTALKAKLAAASAALNAP